jgi:hypothetical protein
LRAVRLEARRRAQQQAALEAGGGHRHVPALPFVADAVVHRHLDVVEEHLGEGLLAVEGDDRADGHARRIQRHQQVDRPWWRLEPGSLRNRPNSQSAKMARVDQVFWPLRM